MSLFQNQDNREYRMLFLPNQNIVRVPIIIEEDPCKLRHPYPYYPDARFDSPLTFPLLGQVNPGVLHKKHVAAKKEKCYVQGGAPRKERSICFCTHFLPRGNQDKGLYSFTTITRSAF